MGTWELSEREIPIVLLYMVLSRPTYLTFLFFIRVDRLACRQQQMWDSGGRTSEVSFKDTLPIVVLAAVATCTGRDHPQFPQ